MAQIEDRILAGDLSAGDHLPDERDLSARLGVSRPSLRESLRVLEALGILEIRRGGDGGAVLAGTPPTSSPSASDGSAAVRRRQCGARSVCRSCVHVS
jgi:DNA-binding FadR family transcriptional regulator